MFGMVALKHFVFAAAVIAALALAVSSMPAGAAKPPSAPAPANEEAAETAAEVVIEPVVSPKRPAAETLETLDATPGVDVVSPEAADTAPAEDLAPEPAEPATSKPRAAKTSAPRPAARTEAAEPPMWRLVDSDSEIFLVGTFHALPKGLDWRSDALAAAADKAQTVIFEAEVDTPRAQKRAQEIIARAGRNRPGVTLSSLLGPDYAPKFAAAAGGLGIDPAALEPARPWQAFLALSIRFLMSAGFDPGAGLEQVMLSEARLRGRQLRFFETIDEQLNLFAGMSPAEEKLLLTTTLDEWDSQAADVQMMLAAWRTGDLDTIDRLMNGAMRDTAPGVYERLIVNRNKAWTDRTEDLLQGTGVVLIAVGAAHLAGPDSLPAMLMARGYAVERWPAAPEQQKPAKKAARR